MSDRFDSKITIILCGDARYFWAQRIARFFQAVQTSDGLDYWKGKPGHVLRLTHWFNVNERKFSLIDLIHLLREYQKDCKQEAIGIELTIQGKWEAWVTYTKTDLLNFSGSVIAYLFD